jgi:uncharacterized protein (TIGR03086 family)
MANPHQAVVVLSRAIDQAGDALASIHRDDWDRPTPCGDWKVRDLAAHLAAAPEHFLQQARGEDVDWSAKADVADGGWADHFRTRGDDLIHHWHEQPDDQTDGAGWQTAEIAVHTWDLARAIKQVDDLDDEVAEAGLAFLQQGLTDENRGNVFGPAVAVADDAPAYDRLAAFAGRNPSV